jgi:transposase InsO family protein
MIPRILEQLDQGRQEFSWKELCYDLLPCATVWRWRARAQAGQPVLEKPGPKKPEAFNLEGVKARIAALDHGPRRSAGTTALQAELSNALSRRRFQELVVEERQNQLDQMKRIQWLVPGTVWSFDTTEYGPQKLRITPLRDLASKYQLPVPLVGAQENGVRIAEYLEQMFQRDGAPLLLKRDLGSPLRCHQVNEVLERYRVLPLDSPPDYPQYNGSMERSMRDLHAALDQVRLQHDPLPIRVDLELATHRLNHRCLRSLGHRTPCQVYHDPAQRQRFHGRSRQRIFREVFEQFWQFLETMPERNRHTFNAAWRLVVETWLRRQGWISVSAKTNNNVSTDSEPFCSQN